MTRPQAPASAMERRFAARPHVGTVTHVEGREPGAVVARLVGALEALGLPAEEAVEDVRGQRLYSVVAGVPLGEGMELWLVVSEVAEVGCKVETRLYHVTEESALADEYLASLSPTLQDAWERNEHDRA